MKSYHWLITRRKQEITQISGDKNLTESVHRKISQTMLNFAWCAKFCTGCEIVFHSVLQLLFLLIFAQTCQIATCWISFSVFLPCISDWLGNILPSLAKAMKCSKAWNFHACELQLALSWIAQNSPSLLVCFNDKKSYQKHQNLPKTDQ